MSQVIRISEILYERLKKHAQGFDTPANVIEKVLNYYESHRGEAAKTELGHPEPPNESPISLEIVYQPSGEDTFKKALLEKKRAYIRTYKLDGTSERKLWNATRFSPSSSVNANLRSGYLRGWRDKGIYKAVITVTETDAASPPTPSRMDSRPYTKDHNFEVLDALGFHEVSIREQAKKWLKQYHPADFTNELRTSKYHSEKDIWFFTFPASYFELGNSGNLNILLQFEKDREQFHFLKVPFSFFKENKEKINIRATGDKFDLHISAKKRNWLSCERSKGISFSKFEK